MSYIMRDVKVKINVTLLTYVYSNSIQDVTKPNLFSLWLEVLGFFYKPNIWDLQMCEFTKISNIVLPTITFKISFKFSPHHTKLLFLVRLSNHHVAWRNIFFLMWTSSFQFKVWLKKSVDKYKIDGFIFLYCFLLQLFNFEP